MLVEFFSVMALIHVLGDVIKQGEQERERAGHGNRCVDYDVRIACDPAGFTQQSTPVVLKGANDIVWITAYNADGDLPREVVADLGVSGGEMIDLSEIEQQARRL
jgi:hypothetical protein